MTARTRTETALTCRSAFQRIARQCVTSVRAHRAAACRGNPEAIHQIRIALTKLRAARKFFAAMTRDAAWPKLKAEIGWLNEALGAARDSDVASGYAKAQPKKTLAVKAGERLARETLQNHRRLAAILRSKRCDRFVAGLEQWIVAGPWLTTAAAAANKQRKRLLADCAPARLQRWKRRLARNSADGMKGGKRRHRLRLAAKRYRYMREALATIGLPEGRTASREREAAQSVQRALGDLRDLQRFKKVQPGSLSAGFYRQRKEKLLREAKDAFRRLG